MEKAIFITKTSNLRYVDGRYSHLYFGNEFCQRLIPTLTNLKRILKYCRKRKLKFSLVTPYVTDEGLEKLELLFELLKDERIDCELIINDWGVLDLINERYQILKPVLGRLLVKQKRDPRISRLIEDKKKTPIMFKSEDGYQVIVWPRRIPGALANHYKEWNVNVLRFQQFLISQRIRRVELDNLIQGMNLRIPKGRLSASIYVPFGYITTTRFCPMETDYQKRMRISSCKKECQRYIFKLRNPTMPKVIYRRGNTFFFKNERLRLREWEEQGIDRLVYQPEIPI